MLIFFVLIIFYILWYSFLLNVANYIFTFSFSCFNLRGIIPSLTQGGGKGIGRLTLCGPMGPMWNQMGETMNGSIMSGRGVIYMDKGARTRTQSQGFPSSTTLEPNGQ